MTNEPCKACETPEGCEIFGCPHEKTPERPDAEKFADMYDAAN